MVLLHYQHSRGCRQGNGPIVVFKVTSKNGAASFSRPRFFCSVPSRKAEVRHSPQDSASSASCAKRTLPHCTRVRSVHPRPQRNSSSPHVRHRSSKLQRCILVKLRLRSPQSRIIVFQYFSIAARILNSTSWLGPVLTRPGVISSHPQRHVYRRGREFAQTRTVPLLNSRKCTLFCSTHRYSVRGETTAAFAAISIGNMLTSQSHIAQRSVTACAPLWAMVSSRLWIVISTRRRNPILRRTSGISCPHHSGNGRVRLPTGGRLTLRLRQHLTAAGAQSPQARGQELSIVLMTS
jgi:hypothetical protein